MSRIRYQKNVVILNQNKDNNDSKKGFDFTKIITVLITALTTGFTIYIGIIQFYYSQNIIDKRKYNYDFYNERFKVVKELSKSISEITTFVYWYSKPKYEQKEKDSISRKLAIFEYSLLIFNQNAKDTVVLNDLRDYKDKVIGWLDGADDCEPSAIASSGRATIKQCYEILKNEKDSLNSFNFKLFPFE